MRDVPFATRWAFFRGRYASTAPPPRVVAELRELARWHRVQVRIATVPLLLAGFAGMVSMVILAWRVLRSIGAAGAGPRMAVGPLLSPLCVGGIFIGFMLVARLILKPSSEALVGALDSRVFPLLARIHWAPGADVTLELTKPGVGRWLTVGGWLSSGVGVWMARDNHSFTRRGDKRTTFERRGGRNYKVTRQHVSHRAWAVDFVRLSFDPSRFPHGHAVAEALRQQTDGLPDAQVSEQPGALGLSKRVPLKDDHAQPQNSLTHMLATFYGMLDPATQVVDPTATAARLA